MNLIEKKKNKQNLKQYKYISYSLFLLVIVLMILSILYTSIIIMIMGIMFMFATLISDIISQSYKERLLKYKKHIIEYRIHRKYYNAMKLIKHGDLILARKIYRSMPHKHQLTNDLYISLTHEFMRSNDKKLKKIGQIAFNNMMCVNDPVNLIEY